LLVCASLTALAQSDRAREARWRAEVEPTLVVGEGLTLNAAGEDFFAIWTESDSSRKNPKALVLVHGVGVHPDFGLVGQLRTLLHDAGYSTLSLQMPVLAKEVSDGNAYTVTFTQSTARIAAAAQWLRNKGYAQPVLITHSMGAWMGNVYFQRTPNADYARWVCIGITGSIGSLGNNHPRVLDLSGSEDFPVTMDAAWLRRMKLWFLPGSETMVVDGANHYFAGKEKQAATVIDAFLKK
jgi:pimeloyl-ACP methyl ester carboxylesterase